MGSQEKEKGREKQQNLVTRKGGSGGLVGERGSIKG